MARAQTEIKVGLTVVLAILTLLFSLLWIKGYRYGRRFYTVQVLFPDVGTLETGDPVLVSGVNRGKVQGVELQSGQVLVTASLGTDVHLKTDAQFAIKNIGLMGERFVDVRTGRAEEDLDLSQPIQGYYDTGIPEVMGVLGRMVSETRELVRVIRATVASDSALSGFAEAIDNSRKLTTELGETVAENRQALAQTIKDLSIAARTLREFTQDNRRQLERTIDQVDSAATSVVALTEHLDTVATGLQVLVSGLEKGQGTLGLLLQDDELYNQLKTAAQNVDVLISDIRANPKKYLQVQVKLF